MAKAINTGSLLRGQLIMVQGNALNAGDQAEASVMHVVPVAGLGNAPVVTVRVL